MNQPNDELQEQQVPYQQIQPGKLVRHKRRRFRWANFCNVIVSVVIILVVGAIISHAIVQELHYNHLPLREKIESAYEKRFSQPTWDAVTQCAHDTKISEARVIDTILQSSENSDADNGSEKIRTIRYFFQEKEQASAAAEILRVQEDEEIVRQIDILATDYR